jgi:hypothetical protein
MCSPVNGSRIPSAQLQQASLVRQECWEALTPEERRGFAPLCPDLVVELASPSALMPPPASMPPEWQPRSDNFLKVTAFTPTAIAQHLRPLASFLPVASPGAAPIFAEPEFQRRWMNMRRGSTRR